MPRAGVVPRPRSIHRVSNADPATQLGDCEKCGQGVALRPHRRSARPGKVEWRCKGATRHGVDYKQPSYKREAHGLNGPESQAYKAGKKCAICGSNEELRVDHDHQTGALRGVLCHRCNTGIGMLDDDVERLQAAIEYLTSTTSG